MKLKEEIVIDADCETCWDAFEKVDDKGRWQVTDKRRPSFIAGNYVTSSSDGSSILERRHMTDHFYVFGVLKWDLGTVALDLDAVPYGRVFNTANWRYRQLRAEIVRMYEERQRLLLELLTSPKRDLESGLFLRLRLEELTAHLDAYTGGLWTPAARWLAALP